MFKIIFVLKLLVFVFVFSSCEVLKEKQIKNTRTETAENRTIYENETRLIYKPKDSVVFVPNPMFVLKDTTIVKRGQTTTLRLNYDTQGTMTKADCYTDEIREFISIQREINEKILTKLEEKEKTKEVERKPDNIIYWFIGVLLLLLLALLSFKVLNK
jgi:hypothetical protein